MLSDSVKLLIHKWINSECITLSDIERAVNDSYQDGLNDGMKIRDNITTLMKASKKGS